MDSPVLEKTRQKLLLAAIKAFARKGYRDATVRDICRQAGAANINAVNYYFGGKDGLYKAILDIMFAEITKRNDAAAQARKPRTPEQRLRDFIEAYCAMLYGSGDAAEDIMTIFIAEMTRPSPYLDEMVRLHTRPQTEEFLDILRDILGVRTPRAVLRDCGASIMGQIAYYSYTWPLFSRVFPDHPGMKKYHTQLSEHVYRFSLGG
jgi:AcrR family transcriptional regulator